MGTCRRLNGPLRPGRIALPSSAQPWGRPVAQLSGRTSPHQRQLVLAPHPGLQHLSVPQSLPLISASRWLLKRGELSVVEEAGLFRKLASRPTCYLFLFNDVLVITKKKRWAPPRGVPGCTHGPAMGVGSSYHLGARRGVGGAGLSLL